MVTSPVPLFSPDKKPFLIAGPCSAETREQVLATAEGLKALPLALFRAGVWKPRTRPGAFEGVGAAALPWLQEVKETYGMKWAVEVAEPHHLEEALAHGADAVWVGARTTVNPFAVQRLADALRGVSIPVLVKNPVNPDLELWIGAIERVERAGVPEVAAIHRGFSSYKSATPYRNAPTWAIPIELRRRRPDLFILCDPSHIAGKRALVAEVAQKAMDMDYHGLMIETHPRPDEAWSDAAQQLTPVGLKELLEDLVIRSGHAPADTGSTLELEHLRSVMDWVDAEILDLLARRMEIGEKIGGVKKVLGMTAFQKGRWADIVETRSARARELRLSEDFILALWEKIHHESVKRQLKILGEGEG